MNCRAKVMYADDRTRWDGRVRHARWHASVPSVFITEHTYWFTFITSMHRTSIITWWCSSRESHRWLTSFSCCQKQATIQIPLFCHARLIWQRSLLASLSTISPVLIMAHRRPVLLLYYLALVIFYDERKFLGACKVAAKYRVTSAGHPRLEPSTKRQQIPNHQPCLRNCSYACRCTAVSKAPTTSSLQ